jgi:phospholipid-binding lipoprotein MlaA
LVFIEYNLLFQKYGNEVLDRRNSNYLIAGLTAAFIVFFVGVSPMLAAEPGGQQEAALLVTQGEPDDAQTEDVWAEEENWEEDDMDEFKAIADPLEPVNRIFFHFNDKLYYWVLKPVARGYKAVLPEDIRIVVRNFSIIFWPRQV